MAIIKTTILDDDSNEIREELHLTGPSEVLLIGLDDARAAWWKTLLDRIDALEKRVHNLEADARRNDNGPASSTTYYSHSQPKSWR